VDLELTPSARVEPTPERTAFDYGLSTAKVMALVFPFLGPGVSLLEILTAPSRGRRLTDWCERFRLHFNELSQKVAGLTPEALAKDEAFVSAFAQATQAALRTHQQEKLDALRNAVLNVALGREPDADRQGQFLSLVDRFTAAHLIPHLILLRFFQDPSGHFEKRRIPIPTVPVGTKCLAYELVCIAMPELHQKLQSPLQGRTGAPVQMIQSLLTDLVTAQLIALERLNEMWVVPRFGGQPAAVLINPVTTHLGNDFLAFITEPA
jgi:hypothetical protein